MTRTIESEFPDFPVETLPTIPVGFTPTHWRQDSCPSWSDDNGIRLFIDYPDSDRRELAGGCRFILYRDRCDGTDFDVESDDWHVILAAIAKARGE